MRDVRLTPDLQQEYEEYLAWLREFERHYAVGGKSALDLDPALSQEKLQLMEQIREAFAHVHCLGEEQLLYGGMADDDHRHPDVRKKLSLLEERHRWEQIPMARLAACVDCLSYLGPEATRFLLPAYMILELQLRDLTITTGIETQFCYAKGKNSLYHDAYTEESRRRRLALLNEAQRATLTAFTHIKRRHEWRCDGASEGWFDPELALLPWEWDEIESRTPPLSAYDYLEELFLDAFLEEGRGECT